MRILREMTARGEVAPRPGAAQFIDDALREGAQVAVVAGTASVPEDGLLSSAIFNLGPQRRVSRPAEALSSRLPSPGISL